MTETTTTPTAVFAPSELVLLFGERFAGQGSMAKGKEELLTGAGTVATNDLGEAALLVALLSLEEAGLLRLEQRSVRWLLGLLTRKTVFAVRTGSPRPWPAGSIEPRLFAALGSGEMDVEDLVYHFFGDDAGWPKQYLLEMIKQGLVGRGLVQREEVKKMKVFTSTRDTLPESTRALLAGQSPDAARALVRAAEGRDGGEFIKALRKRIDAGFSRRTERSAGDNDGDYGGSSD